MWIFASVMFLALPVLAKEVSFEATVDSDTVCVGRPFGLSLVFNSTQQIPAPELPRIGGFQSQYVGSSTMMSVANGQVSSSVTHRYSLLAKKTGQFTLGPFRIEHNGDTYVSNPITVEVTKDLVRNEPRQDGVQPQTEDLDNRIFLVIQLGKNKACVNETIPFTAKLYVTELSVRDIQFPRIDHECFSVGPFGPPRQYREVIGGTAYDVIEFNATVTGLKTGEFRIGPARLGCNLVVKREGSRQHQMRPLQIKSTDIPVTIVDVTQENQSAEF